MDLEEDYVHLPEDLVERILAMVPYPYIFKARVLSKSWLARLSPISSQSADETKKQLAISFQKRVNEFSMKWTTFCPVLFGKDDLLAYDREAQRWRRIPTLSFLPDKYMVRSSYGNVEIEGNVVIVSFSRNDMTVANILTRSWEHLPPTPDHNKGPYATKCVVEHNGTYRVFNFRFHVGYSLVEIYESEKGYWTCYRQQLAQGLEVLTEWGPHLDGVFYWVVSLGVRTSGLLTFNVEEQNFKVLPMQPANVPIKRNHFALVVCNGSLLMLLYTDDLSRSAVRGVTILKIDLGSQKWWEVNKGPPPALCFGKFYMEATSDGEFLFFEGQHFDEILAYNGRTHEWSYMLHPTGLMPQHIVRSKNYIWNTRPFRAGLHPFVEF